MRLTKRAVESIAPSGRQSFVWDDDLPGFGVRVYPTGRLLYFVQYRLSGRTRRVKIGLHGVVTPDAARQRARLILSDVSRGCDPAAERAARRQAKTVSELADAYLELHARPRKRSASDDEQRLKKYVRPALGSKVAIDVARPDVIGLHRTIGRTGGEYVANRVLALISSMWSWAEREGLLPANHPNPARGVVRFRETSRDRWLTPDEVKRVATALGAEPSIYVRAYFALALLTGAQKRELLSIRWSDIEGSLLRIGQTKNGEPHVVPLPEVAMSILEALPNARGTDAVFASNRRPGEPLAVAVIDQAWRRIRVKAKAPDARFHDIRRTLGSWMVQAGASLPLIGRALNHRSQSATAVYARLALDGVRQAFRSHADELERAGLSAHVVLGPGEVHERSGRQLVDVMGIGRRLGDADALASFSPPA